MSRGAVYALSAAALFGLSTPLAKLLLGHAEPLALAAILYLGSGLGLASWRLLAPRRASAAAKLQRSDLGWLAAAIVSGGVIAPILLLAGLSRTTAASASLLLNSEGVLTALIAWFVFRENFDRRIAAGMVAIAGGAIVLSWGGEARFSIGSVAIIAACALWALDNNLTRRISAADPVAIAMWKGLVAGTVNAAIALARGAELPGTSVIAGAALLGFASYGISLVLFVSALQEVGTARTGAYFSTAPFIGTLVSIAFLHDQVTLRFVIAAGLMSFGVWLHLTERHAHDHTHEELSHTHVHIHDEHHQHLHADADPPGEPHAHPHRHDALEHEHSHHPDIHHRHAH